MASLMPRGYRSATEFRFDKEQADAIIRTTAYHRKDFCLSVIWYSHREHNEIRPSITTPFQRTSKVGLGSLDRLPLELLFDTLYRLDLYSLFKFRQINLRSRQMVDFLNQYRRVVSHGLNLFCALLRTRLAIDVTLLDFYKALCTKTCILCGEFGGFISILTWTRCCFKCLQGSPETQVRTLASVRKQLHMTKAELGQLRSFKSLPGIYSMNESVQNSHTTIVSLHRATLTEIKSSTSWGHVHSLITTNKLAALNTGFHVPGVNLLLKKILSAPGVQNGGTTLETKCMRKTAFWATFDGVNRHSSYGGRVAKVKPCHLSYLCLLGQEATFEEENDDHMEPTC
ncbi:F-box domain protein [Aspergillus clavatus NRRL 1]|uniref:F-box domain protein n=1 Tax=Aspergillus clavatus (strain ATCC 1007 / CBS 513.65 / DSM 816 / NCTC 3887 / NRRL 1 / QM 1276 / 107) TaxID=344612 RepID=A1CEZ7_ASPCL|nr:F-box domain protein [Aspergillus clavatus NRRL 1]EAW11446.1 F-box domain protein [Aspergillus clavatus NRRL 1]